MNLASVEERTVPYRKSVMTQSKAREALKPSYLRIKVSEEPSITET